MNFDTGCHEVSGGFHGLHNIRSEVLVTVVPRGNRCLMMHDDHDPYCNHGQRTSEKPKRNWAEHRGGPETKVTAPDPAGYCSRDFPGSSVGCDASEHERRPWLERISGLEDRSVKLVLVQRWHVFYHKGVQDMQSGRVFFEEAARSWILMDFFWSVLEGRLRTDVFSEGISFDE